MNTTDTRNRLNQLAKDLLEAGDVAGVYFVAGELEKLATEYTDRYDEGVRDALAELGEVYGEGIEETDLWAEYMNKEGEE